MSRRPEASVVIASRHDDDVIDRPLLCLADQGEARIEVVIADNGGSPGLRRIAERWRADLDVRVVDATARIGCGPARNVGVAAARTDRLLFCDAGDWVGPRWVAAFVEALDQDDLATGPKAIVVPDAVQPATRAEQFARAAFSSGPNTAGTRPYASGGNAAYRRATLDLIGGFCTHNLRREDVEASWLAQDRGCTLGFAPEAKVLYVARHGFVARWRQSYGYGAGIEALARQLDPDRRWMQPTATFVKLGLARTRRDPANGVPFVAGLAGRIAERAMPGRYVEGVRRRADLPTGEALRSLRALDEGEGRGA